MPLSHCYDVIVVIQQVYNEHSLWQSQRDTDTQQSTQATQSNSFTQSPKKIKGAVLLTVTTPINSKVSKSAVLSDSVHS